ncbi:unnamed protein product [Durusdinium trenchii]|uniref:Uncharacterized protein n=1 Tax=Durusdinium trenchii TaxID=1381693 RepID=A0ABP0NNW3_9DINO
MAVAFKMELSRPAPLQLPSEPPSPAGSLVFTPGNAPSTYWRTTICPGAPYKRDQRAGSTPRSGPPTPAVSWPSPTSLAFEPSFQLTPTNTLSSAFPETFFRPTRPTLRRACTLPPAHETVDSDDDEELLDFQIDRTVSEPHVPQAVWKDVDLQRTPPPKAGEDMLHRDATRTPEDKLQGVRRLRWVPENGKCELPK